MFKLSELFEIENHIRDRHFTFLITGLWSGDYCMKISQFDHIIHELVHKQILYLCSFIVSLFGYDVPQKALLMDISEACHWGSGQFGNYLLIYISIC